MSRPDPALVRSIRERRIRPGVPVPVGDPYEGEQLESLDSRRERLGEEAIVLERQCEVYEMRCAGISLREIAATVGISQQLVLDDLHAEAARRMAALSGSAEQKIALSVTRYEGVLLRALNRIAIQEERRQQGASGATRLAFLDEKIIMEAQERIDRVQGLLRVTPGETAPPIATDTTVNIVLQDFVKLPPATRLTLLERVREEKARRERQAG